MAHKDEELEKQQAAQELFAEQQVLEAEMLEEQQLAQMQSQENFSNYLPFQNAFAKAREGIDLAKEFSVFKNADDKTAYVEKVIHNVEEARSFAADMGIIFSESQLDKLSGILNHGKVGLGLVGKALGVLADMDDPTPVAMTNNFCWALAGKGAADLPRSASLKDVVVGHPVKYEQPQQSNLSSPSVKAKN